MAKQEKAKADKKAPARVNPAPGSKGELMISACKAAISLFATDKVKGMPTNTDAQKEARSKAHKDARNEARDGQTSGGTISRIAASGTGDKFNEMLKACKAVGPEIATNTYGPNCKALVKWMQDNSGGTGGAKIRNFGSLADALKGL